MNSKNGENTVKSFIEQVQLPIDVRVLVLSVDWRQFNCPEEQEFFWSQIEPYEKSLLKKGITLMVVDKSVDVTGISDADMTLPVVGKND